MRLTWGAAARLGELRRNSRLVRWVYSGVPSARLRAAVPGSTAVPGFLIFITTAFSSAGASSIGCEP
jgi:hypothetical protein